MSTPVPKLFLFDIDGTLLSSNWAGSRSFMRSARQVLGLVDEVESVLMAGKLDRVIFQEILEANRPDLSDGTSEKYWRSFEEGYLELLQAESENPEGWALFPGVKQLLDHCSSLGDLALLTGNVRRGAYIKLSALGVDSYFPTGAFGEELIDRSGLARAAFKEARAHFQTDFLPGNTFVIGDTQKDIEAGRAIGARTVSAPDAKLSTSRSGPADARSSALTGPVATATVR
ncbi:MAG: HAD hydrolase-like protein, partial [Gemmatimonadota bacterium]|nr:HAD hydrolase-like protein [Gemmatimonadota bacterium]